jgi:hypothetical protein
MIQYLFPYASPGACIDTRSAMVIQSMQVTQKRLGKVYSHTTRRNDLRYALCKD